jgi:glutathione S-transferase
MKIYLNKTSPYARLVMIVAHEKRLADNIDLIWVDPWASGAELLAVNPLSRVPVLVTDSGVSVTESTAICDLLDQFGGEPRLLPAELIERTVVLHKYGLGRGLIDCSFGVTIERRFGSKANPLVLAERWLTSTARAVDAIAADSYVIGPDQQLDLGDLAIAVGLSYTRFRLPEISFGKAAGSLIAWCARLEQRPSFVLTAPE